MTRGRAAPRLGLYGGTFNPIHLGHLRAAQEVLEALALERMLFIPSAAPPHKRPGHGPETVAPAADRLAWVRAAVDDHPHFAVDEIEIARPGPSYTVDTLRAVAARGSAELPVFVIGRDAFEEIGTWREPEALLPLAHFAVTARPPIQDGCLGDWLPECFRDAVELASDGRSARHRRAETWIRQVEITALDISASAIRGRIHEGRSIRYLVPESIRSALVASGSYANELVGSGATASPGPAHSRRTGHG